jgi:uncharacterized repeat protein (TIGR03803 family)
MNPHLKHLFLLCATATIINLAPAERGSAQTFTNVHSFTLATDGGILTSALIVSGNTLYGTASIGGSSGSGTVFRVNTDGTAFTNLHSFTATSGTNATNGDGYYPDAGLVLSGNTLYGTAEEGGGFGRGTIFAVNTDSTGFTNLHSFAAASSASTPSYTNSDGAYPNAGLLLLGGTLYGTASIGGTSGQGTVFGISTNGQNFTNLHSFTGGSDGSQPQAGLLLLSNKLCGTTEGGGTLLGGEVFEINTNGNGLTNLHNFNYATGGSTVIGGLTLSGNTFYGTTYSGSGPGNGTVFRVNTDASAFTNLYTFSALVSGTNYDGANPNSSLTLVGNTLFGTTLYGGRSGNGTVFAINTDGTGFNTIHALTAISGSSPSTNYDGDHAAGALTVSGSMLYGTTESGGSKGRGTIFGFPIPPRLTITPAGTNVVITWPTNVAGFQLQSAASLGSNIVWAAVSPAAIIVSGQYTVTNAAASGKVYELVQ